MKYPNLEAEMSRIGITGAEMAEGINVGRSTIYNWMNGSDAAFPIIKAKEVRDKYFKGQSLDYLFSEEALVANP